MGKRRDGWEVLLAITLIPSLAYADAVPVFAPYQTDVFNRGLGQAVAWADFDGDGDMDLVVGFRNSPLALYVNSGGRFEDMAAELGLIQKATDIRSLSWGDYNLDGRPDIYVGFGRDTGVRNQLYRNDGDGFTEVGDEVGVDLLGTSRQAAWIDYDNDGDSDLFVAMRDRQSRLLRNDDGSFTNVSRESGLNDPRRTVGAVWFDFDKDGDLDVFLANQSGDTDAFYRNDGGLFVDVAPELSMHRLPGLEGRSLSEGSVGASVCDVNNDGWFDLFVPSYGRDVLYVADGLGGFYEAGGEWRVANTDLAVSSDCGDLNNDGLPDIYLAAYVSGEAHGQDAFLWNDGERFIDSFPDELMTFDADHGVRFADFDNDGDLDIALTNRADGGRVSLLRNELDTEDARSISVRVLDENGFATRQGAEVRVFDNASGELIGSGIVDTGGGYVSQNAIPVHVGVAGRAVIDIEVTFMSAAGRDVKRVTEVNVAEHVGRAIVVGP